MPCQTIITDSKIAASFKTGEIQVNPSSMDTGCWKPELKYAKFDLVIGDESIIRDNDYVCYEYSQVGSIKTAHIGGIHLIPNRRDLGIGKMLITQNSKVYKSCGFQKIELNAISEGVAVWPRLGFKFCKGQDSKLLSIKMRKYLVAEKGVPPEETRNVDIYSVQSGLLKEQAGAIAFTDWLEVNHLNQAIKMSKEL